MAAEYKLIVKNSAGTVKAQVVDFLALAYEKEVNFPGVCVFDLNGEHQAIDHLITGSSVEVWRRDTDFDIDWYADFRGLFEDEQRWYEGGHDLYRAYCPSLLSKLDWRIVNWSAGTNNKSEFIGITAEGIMKTLVDYNLGQNADSPNRKLSNVDPNVFIAANQSRGNDLNWSCHGDNVLKSVQELALIGGGDFDFIVTGSSAWFEFYPNQLGTDRSATLLFSLDRGNMANPEYKITRSKMKTVAAVWGRGEGSLRDYVTRTSSAYVANTQSREIYVDARNTDGNTAGYNSAGDAALAQTKAIHEFTFDVLQTPSARYGLHYFLGDKVSATYKGITVTPKIVRASISVDKDNSEVIQIQASTKW